MALSPAQCRAGRLLLGWTLADLSRAAQVSESTILDFEHAIRTPRTRNLAALFQALEDGGIELLCDDGRLGPGARLRHSEVEMTGHATIEDKFAVLPIRYRNRKYLAYIALIWLERLARRNMANRKDVEEAVTKFRSDVATRALQQLHANPKRDVVVIDPA